MKPVQGEYSICTENDVHHAELHKHSVRKKLEGGF